MSKELRNFLELSYGELEELNLHAKEQRKKQVRIEKIREEVVGVDEKTKIEKGGSNVKLRDLQQTDKALINYEPEAYTPAIAIKVTGKGKLKKTGGDD